MSPAVCRYTCSREQSLNVSRHTYANAVARANLMLRRNEQRSRMLRLSLAAAGVAYALHASQCVRACVRALFGSAGSFFHLPNDCFQDLMVAGIAVMQPTSLPLLDALTPICQSLK